MSPHINGSVEVITGSMFSGKTDELIRRLRRAAIARQKVQVFKPAMDVRYAVEKVTSHAGTDFDAIPIEHAADLYDRLEKDTTVVAIDEAQFFDDKIIAVVDELARRGIRVIVAGLDTDFRGEPFGPMPVMMAKPSAWTSCRPSAWCAANRPAARSAWSTGSQPATTIRW